MCGIAGKLDRRGGAVDTALLERMGDALRHRGPDAHGTYADGPVGLAHRRLAIIDLSDAGRQPMASADGRYWIVFNGEIYNFLTLRAELEGRGYTFASKTDTEVLLYLYHEYGEAMLPRLNGMFAFAIWDGQRRELFLARDRVGKKPLYYCATSGFFAFASELKAILLDPEVPRRIDYHGLADFLTYGFVPDPKTTFEGLRKLPPGHWMRVDAESERQGRYWDLTFAPDLGPGEDEWEERLREQLREAVSCRKIADVPLGAFLSGGIDSSAVVAMMASDAGGPVITSAIGFEEDAFNELEFARQVAQRYRTEHHEDVVHYDRFEAILETLLWHFEEPFCDESAIPTYYLSKLARQYVTVALSGDGGDEGFAGYTKYSQMMREEAWRRRLPGWLLGRVPGLLRSRPWSRLGHRVGRLANFVESAAADRVDCLFLANARLREHEAHDLFSPSLHRQLDGYRPRDVIADHASRAGTDDFLSTVLYVDTMFLLPGDFLVKVDRMSMASSLEVRCPFLDHRLLELAATIPSDLKIHGGEKKYILKRSLEGQLPRGILYRRKQGFDVPLVSWFASSLRPYLERELIDDPGILGEFFELGYVRRLCEEFFAGRKGHKSLLWNLLMFKLWHRRWIGEA